MSKPGLFRANLPELAQYLLKNGPRKTRPTFRRVRIILNHTYIVDTTKAVHVWEHDGYPQYYIPTSELRNCNWKDKQNIHAENDGASSPASVVEVTVATHDGLQEFKTDRALRFSDDEKAAGVLSGLIRLEFGSMDQWLEEEVPIHVHPKDPFKRIDILPSSRSVEVRVAGKTVAKTDHAVHLLETGLPTRYYLPLSAVDQSVLRKSEFTSQCPYKGDAEYYHVVVDGQEHRDLVWYYRLPTHESAAIAELLCFYNEKVDIILDGELLERPKTMGLFAEPDEVKK
ncbi:hypothetical protein Cob_v004833 [Colletotrichum orbiculare MAFF 240422]|uniref:DUF427 domain-containing protein n=1 Tax=Colletotrichum orbiculare (strain 104-T / ATCC 96160 / CBS 514.97 / LARS 414 / MAFF 240422) TaxID=1213857 RepID=N4VAA8_COLOR|nr:hypothetical protein Cob_v004833 [Colletotrichum orbiculare MAFF 240422]